ncbi:MAG: flagellar hook-associated protein FlgK [Lachnospiraceae bacterium]|nr:flagellar hook-associated protein FlgK [Lachnospiraceae bacterium]
MPLMSALYVGASGLQTSQNALNTTAHNLANVNTTGYTRQQVYQGNRELIKIGESYNNTLQAGLGVAYTDVRAVRDEFLDNQYRTESGRSAYYSTSYEVVQEINTLFGETEGTEFQTSLQNLRDSLENLAKSPADATVQAALVSTASQFLDRANAVYTDLQTYQGNLNQQIKDQVDRINEYAEKIAKLNDEITKYEVTDIESPNDLRDARDQLLDELSAYGKITYREDLYGRVKVFFEGVTLVDEDTTNPMEAKVLKGDEESGFVTPVWPRYNDQAVFNNIQPINADIGSDNGSLKALYFSRGDKSGTWNDLNYDPDNPGSNPVYDSSDPNNRYYRYDAYYSEGKVSFTGPSNFNIAEVQAEFDNLIHNIVTSINDILTDDHTNGSPELFTRITTHREATNTEYPSGMKCSDIEAKELSITEAVPAEYQGYMFENATYTTANLMINKDLLRQPTLLSDSGNGGFIKDDQTVDYDKAKQLADLFSTDKTTLNPNTVTKFGYENYYIEIVNQYANVGNTYRSLTQGQEAAVLSIENSRQQVVGVSDNEELTKMIRFQNAYNASSRYINTINSMLDTLLTSLT